MSKVRSRLKTIALIVALAFATGGTGAAYANGGGWRHGGGGGHHQYRHGHNHHSHHSPHWRHHHHRGHHVAALVILGGVVGYHAAASRYYNPRPQVVTVPSPDYVIIEEPVGNGPVRNVPQEGAIIEEPIN